MNLLYGVTIGSALILVASGLSLTFGMMGVLNFAHGSLYMLGGYFGYTLAAWTGSFWLALLIAPFIVGFIGFLIEYFSKTSDNFVFLLSLLMHTTISSVTLLILSIM